MQQTERTWRAIKRGLSHQTLTLLRRNLNVEMFQFNNLQVNMSLVEKRETVLQVIGKRHAKIKEMKTQLTITVRIEGVGFLV